MIFEKLSLSPWPAESIWVLLSPFCCRDAISYCLAFFVPDAKNCLGFAEEMGDVTFSRSHQLTTRLLLFWHISLISLASNDTWPWFPFSPLYIVGCCKKSLVKNDKTILLDRGLQITALNFDIMQSGFTAVVTSDGLYDLKSFLQINLIHSCEFWRATRRPIRVSALIT